MNKELIAMSDCPEIQDRWKPKLGDWVANFVSTRDKINKDTIKLGKKYIGTVCLTSPAQVQDRELAVWTPSIEDVLEWTKGNIDSLNNHTENWTVVYYKMRGEVELEGDIGDSLIVALLKAYMHLEHNKTWNGEAWV